MDVHAYNYLRCHFAVLSAQFCLELIGTARLLQSAISRAHNYRGMMLCTITFVTVSAVGLSKVYGDCMQIE